MAAYDEIGTRKEANSSKTPHDTRRMTWWAVFCGANATVLGLVRPDANIILALPLLLTSLVLSGIKFYQWTHYDRDNFGGAGRIEVLAVLVFILGLVALWVPYRWFPRLMQCLSQ